MKRTVAVSSSCTSLGGDGDGDAFERDRCVEYGYMSDREYVLEEAPSNSHLEAFHGTSEKSPLPVPTKCTAFEVAAHSVLNPHQDNQSASTLTDSEGGSDEEESQDQHYHTGKQAYTSACTRLGIVPVSHILARLSSERLSLRHALLNPASAAALSEGLSSNRCIRSLNLGSNLLGDDSARAILEAISGNPALTKLDLSRNLLSDRFGEILAQSLSSPLCALRDLVLADNFFSDRFTDALSIGMRKLRVLSLSPLRHLDVSNNKICDRDGETLASILRSCPLYSLNLSWNDLRESETFKKAGADDIGGSPLASAALAHPGRLVSLELSFNGLPDAFGAIIGGMLERNSSLAVLDLSRNHLGKLSAENIADGLKNNKGLRTLKLGWNALGREGTLGIIRAVGDNQGPLQVVRLENTTDAGLEFEAARQAELAVSTRKQWVEVVCEFPDRSRTKGNSRLGPVSWMTEHAPDLERNTTYKTRQEQEYDEQSHWMGSYAPTAPTESNTISGGHRTTKTRAIVGATAAGANRPSRANLTAPLPAAPVPSFKSPRTSSVGKKHRETAAVVSREEGEQVPHRAYVGPAKEAVAVPVLSVRLKLRAREEARAEAERLAVVEAEVAEEEETKMSEKLSYLKPLNKRVREKTLAEPPPRLLLLRKAKAKADTYSRVKRRVGAEGGKKTVSRGVSGTPRRLGSANNKRATRGADSRSQSAPGYMQTTSRRAGARTPNTGAIGGFEKGGKTPKRHTKSMNQRLQALRNGGQRSTARGRSRSAGRSRGGATRSWRGHESKTRKTHVRKSGGDRSSSKGARRNSRSSAPSRSTWPAMSTLVQVEAPPSRLKLRGKQ